MKNSHKNRIVSTLLAASMLWSLTACGGGVSETEYDWGNVAIGGGGYITGISGAFQ